MNQQYSNIENQLLVMDAQDGDAKAVEKLVNIWNKRLWRHAYRVTCDEQASWDITQQGWLAILKGLKKLHDPARFQAWAYRIITNKAIDWIKKNKSNKHIGIDQAPEIQSRPDSDLGIMESLDQLDSKKKTILTLYYFEQLTVREIGIALKIPGGTVKSRLYSARNELKELWRQNNE